MALPFRLLPLRCDFRLWHGEQSPREFGHPVELLARRWLALWLWGHRRRFPRSRWRRLLALRRSGAQIGASQVGVGEALAHDGGQHAHEATPVIGVSVIEPMHLLVNIPEQVEGVNADVGALDRPLQEAPEILQAIGMDLPAHVLPRVVDRFVLVQLGQLALAVLAGSVGVELRALLDGRDDVPVQCSACSRSSRRQRAHD